MNCMRYTKKKEKLTFQDFCLYFLKDKAFPSYKLIKFWHLPS